MPKQYIRLPQSTYIGSPLRPVYTLYGYMDMDPSGTATQKNDLEFRIWGPGFRRV